MRFTLTDVAEKFKEFEDWLDANSDAIKEADHAYYLVHFNPELEKDWSHQEEWLYMSIEEMNQISVSLLLELYHRWNEIYPKSIGDFFRELRYQFTTVIADNAEADNELADIVDHTMEKLNRQRNNHNQKMNKNKRYRKPKNNKNKKNKEG